MTYAVSGPLQAAVYQHLVADAALGLLVGPAIYDALPAGPLPPLYLTLGPEKVRERSDKTGTGAEHELTVTVTADAGGFAPAKAAAAAVCDALDAANLTLARGHLVFLAFLRATAARVGSGDSRQIDLIFRARVDDL